MEVSQCKALVFMLSRSLCVYLQLHIFTDISKKQYLLSHTRWLSAVND